MKRNRKTLRYTKTMARYFKKNNIREMSFRNDIDPIDTRFFKPYRSIIKSYRKTIVTFNDGTQKEAKAISIYPLKLIFEEDNKEDISDMIFRSLYKGNNYLEDSKIFRHKIARGIEV